MTCTCMLTLASLIKGKVCIRANVAHQAGAYPSFCSMKRLGVFLLPPDSPHEFLEDSLR